EAPPPAPGSGAPPPRDGRPSAPRPGGSHTWTGRSGARTALGGRARTSPVMGGRGRTWVGCPSLEAQANRGLVPPGTTGGDAGASASPNGSPWGWAATASAATRVLAPTGCSSSSRLVRLRTRCNSPPAARYWRPEDRSTTRVPSAMNGVGGRPPPPAPRGGGGAGGGGARPAPGVPSPRTGVGGPLPPLAAGGGSRSSGVALGIRSSQR